MKYRIAFAGSTRHTLAMAQAIANDPRFAIAFTLSPTPKPIGRKKILTKNPLQEWSEKCKIKSLLVDRKIDQNLRQILTNMGETGKIDLLLVVDFGYLIPSWLLKWPQLSPLNIHPSWLPRWRGSSPGQFCLLCQDLQAFGGQESAVTLMIMNENLDQGSIITQLPFTVKSDWTQIEYYQHAFDLMEAKLADLLVDFATGKIHPRPQPTNSPTMVARRLSKQDGFIKWPILQKMMTGTSDSDTIKITDLGNELLTNLLQNQNQQNYKKLIVNANKAFSPWPGLWTNVPTPTGEQRMKILSCHLDANKNNLILDSVQIEGKSPCLWNEAKNAILF